MKDRRELTKKVANTIYNRILDVLSFLATMLFIVAKLMMWTDRSWWWILFPILLPLLFRADEDEDESNNSEDGENNSNTLKMA